ncbi:MAG TPA: metallopeptidase family protein [Candidatus Paceibacterota bacterium]|nr:metallopeptidase family protein [Candidatus Paceibacterota bacterium]
MTEAEFNAIVQAEWNAVPPQFAGKIDNVALLIEDEPSEELRREEGLEPGETLLGHYHGIPNTARGSEYGIGATLPDTITLYRLPILAQAQEDTDDATSMFPEMVRRVVRETIWHELGHYFGYDEEPIQKREGEGTNRFE